MTTFEIPKGDVWAGSFLKRHWNRVSGLTFGKQFQWNIELDMTKCPIGTTIKLCGISTASPFRWQRVSKGGWSEAFNFTHEDSDRVIATKKSDSKIELSSYIYRKGCGPSTEMPQNFEASKKLGVVEENSEFWLMITEGSESTAYSLNSQNQKNFVNMPRNQPMGWRKHRTFAHAKGYNQPNSPANIQIKANVLR
jgi:hypothetical protein